MDVVALLLEHLAEVVEAQEWVGGAIDRGQRDVRRHLAGQRLRPLMEVAAAHVGPLDQERRGLVGVTDLLG